MFAWVMVEQGEKQVELKHMRVPVMVEFVLEGRFLPAVVTTVVDADAGIVHLFVFDDNATYPYLQKHVKYEPVQSDGTGVDKTWHHARGGTRYEMVT